MNPCYRAGIDRQGNGIGFVLGVGPILFACTDVAGHWHARLSRAVTGCAGRRNGSGHRYVR